MARKAAPKKRGRPATGRDPVIAGRVPAELIAEMDLWAKREGLGRSEAMRRLIEVGLKRSSTRGAKS